MDGMIASLQGDDSHTDNSSRLRALFRDIGWAQLAKTPFFGIGISNACILAARYAYRTYLHCNYAELAADGGLVGLFIYYIPYLYILIVEAKNIKKDPNSIIIIILVLLNLILDYGRVSYYSKDTYFLFMIYTIHIEHLRRRKTA
jgi:O-antigen ligase